jgi:uncharacterized protein
MLDDARILITGASAGLGREFARQLAPRASGLALLARRDDRLEDLRKELLQRAPSLRVSIHTCDLADREARNAALAEIETRHGAIDVLINNAGVGSYGRFPHADWSLIEQMLRVNVEAHSYLVHRLVPGMIARKSGAILNVASGQGFQCLPGYASYAGTKHYVVGFTEGLQMELRGTGVGVTLLCPGQTRTEFFDVAGPGSRSLLPSFMEMDAAPVVKIALRALERGERVVIPGLKNRLALALGSMSPRGLRHWVLSHRFKQVELPLALPAARQG